jgi:hypothetical protein
VGGERLYTNEADPASREAIGTGNSLGEIFTVSQNGRTIVGGSSWVEEGVFFPWWQVWNKDTGVLLREGDITALPDKPFTGWLRFSLADLGAGTTPLTPLAPATSVNYIVCGWTGPQAGNQVFTAGGFAYPFGESPLSATGSVFGTNGQARDVMPNFTGFTNGRFYFDVTLESSFLAARPFIVSVASRSVLDRLKRLGRNLFTRPAIVDPPSALPDPITYTVGPPESRWHVGPPKPKWDINEPAPKWTAGPPRGED